MSLSPRTQPTPHGLFVIREQQLVHAPIDRLFELTCSLALVHQELGMTAVAGRTTGLVQAGDTIRWQGWQLGLPQFHVSLISGFDPPHFLQDTMLAGRFAYFQHDHHLRETPEGTLLQDELRFRMKWGMAGRAAGKVLLLPHVTHLLRSRFARLKRIAESDAWRQYLTASPERPAYQNGRDDGA